MISNFLRNGLVNQVLQAASAPTVAGLYVGLFTAMPDVTNDGTEVSGGSYARQSIAQSSSGWSANDNGGCSYSGAAVTFPVPTANWGNVIGWGLFTASTGGNLLFAGPISPGRVISSGAPGPYFPQNSLRVCMGCGC